MNAGQELRAEQQMLAAAVGGTRGLLDSGAPSLVFVLTYWLSGSMLSAAVWAAVAAGAVIALWRAVRRQPLTQVLSGFVGVAVCAFVAARSGRAEDFYLPGLLLNLGLGLLFLLTVAVGHPVLGYAVAGASGDLTSWRRDPQRRRAYALVTLLFAAAYLLRVLVQTPLYWAGAIGALAVAKVVMGYPLLGLVLYLSYRVVRGLPAAAAVAADARAPVDEGQPAASSPSSADS